MNTSSQVLSFLIVALVVIAAGFSIFWLLAILRKPKEGENQQRVALKPLHLVIGFITDFLDTLGIGSFATTTSMYRATKLVDDGLLPGTLNVGHTLPTIAQALFYIRFIDVDVTTLVLLIAASVVGATVGASLVVRLPKHAVQLGIGSALAVAAVMLTASLLDYLPKGGDATQLTGGALVLAIVCNLIFGALMTIGVGAYAPIMIMVSLLGMNAKTAFPIMMGSCAFLMPMASYKFIKSGKYDLNAALGLTLLGIPGVIVAAVIVKELPLGYVKWLVVGVALFTSISLISSGMKQKQQASTGESAPDSGPRYEDPANPYAP